MSNLNKTKFYSFLSISFAIFFLLGLLLGKKTDIFNMLISRSNRPLKQLNNFEPRSKFMKNKFDVSSNNIITYEIERKALKIAISNYKAIFNSIRLVNFNDSITGAPLGYQVRSLDKNSPIYNYGIRAGDILIYFNDEKINSIPLALKNFAKVKINLNSMSNFKIGLTRSNDNYILNYNLKD